MTGALIVSIPDFIRSHDSIADDRRTRPRSNPVKCTAATSCATSLAVRIFAPHMLHAEIDRRPAEVVAGYARAFRRRIVVFVPLATMVYLIDLVICELQLCERSCFKPSMETLHVCIRIHKRIPMQLVIKDHVFATFNGQQVHKLEANDCGT